MNITKNISKIISPFKNNRPKPLDASKEFSLVVPLFVWNEKIHFLFQIRSKNLSRQPGQICFPGGALEKGESLKEGAIRETCEELGLKESNINIISQLDFLVSPYNIVLYPFLGIIYQNPNSLNVNKDEVSDTFTISLKEALSLKPKLSIMDVEPIPKDDFPYELTGQGNNYNWSCGKYPIYFYQYKNKIIWGFTARIFKDVIEKLSDS
ncbi:CoA pyrophosphatase [Proteinivorax tanatarense]|uniref:CoA pyrophosphatase n=1 Tax=Proteinivorax tanatarense TaxID=1260629 RepID=A0AAU7VJK0_9FIRM